MQASIKDHPARYSAALIPELVSIIKRYHPRRGGILLDPMAGTGRADLVAKQVSMRYVGVEIEPEWARHNPHTLIGDATNLPIKNSSIDVVCVSPAYANRMADNYGGSPKDREDVAKGAKRMRRLTYRLYLERALNPNNGAGMQWGDKVSTVT